MNIAHLNKAEVLAALYNASKQQGLGFLHSRGTSLMTIEQAQEELDNNKSKYFDYLHGRVMKLDLSDNELRTDLYNRDNGSGAAEAALENLTSKQPDCADA